MEIDYQKSYEVLKEWVTNLRPYCYNCLHEDSDEDTFCDECHRKSIGWECDTERLPELIFKDEGN